MVFVRFVLRGKPNTMKDQKMLLALSLFNIDSSDRFRLICLISSLWYVEHVVFELLATS